MGLAILKTANCASEADDTIKYTSKGGTENIQEGQYFNKFRGAHIYFLDRGGGGDTKMSKKKFRYKHVYKVQY